MISDMKWRRGEKGRKVGEALGTGLEALRSLDAGWLGAAGWWRGPE